MAASVFINYRRDDIGMAGRLHELLVQELGRDSVFMGVHDIPPGVDFLAYLSGQVAACDVMLVVIGPNWLNSRDESGGRRLDDPDDFVAIELAAALARNILVIPVLVEGAQMPRESELPDNLKRLARRQAAQIRNASFGRDAEALVERMGERLGGTAPNRITFNQKMTSLTNKLQLLLARAGWHKLPRPAARVPLNKQLSAAEMENFAALHRDRTVVSDVADTVECSVFAPPAVPPAETALIQAFLHLPEQAERANFLASAMDSSTTFKGTRSLEIEIKRGAKVELSLAGSGLLIDEPVQSVVWQGQPIFCQFLVTVPAGTSGHGFFPVVRVSIDGVLVGCIKFRILSDSSATNPQSRPLGDHARRYEKAFVSYATKDRKEVLKRVQMLNVMKTKFFLDLLSLDPGDRWEKKLYETIPQCDLFLLFWSQAAKDSTWVNREVEYALNQQSKNQDGEPDIVPVILEQNVSPPPSLAALHFNDRIQYLISLMP